MKKEESKWCNPLPPEWKPTISKNTEPLISANGPSIWYLDVIYGRKPNMWYNLKSFIKLIK